MNCSLKQLAYVAEAARQRSVAAAAHQLRISPSSVIAAIDKVEAEYGVRLFVRRRAKGLSLTRTGTDVVARIGRLLAEVERFEGGIADFARKVEGELHLGCFFSVSPHLLPQIIAEMTRDHPGISVHLHEGDLPAMRDYLRQGTVDVSLAYAYEGIDEMVTETLTEAPYHVVLAADDPLAEEPRVALADLAARPMILLDLDETRRHLLGLFETRGLSPKVVHRTRSYEMVRSLVAAGLGFAILNMRPVIDTSYGGRPIVCRPLADRLSTPRFVLATRPQDPRTRLVEVFAEYCRRYFGSQDARRHIVG